MRTNHFVDVNKMGFEFPHFKEGEREKNEARRGIERNLGVKLWIKNGNKKRVRNKQEKEEEIIKKW